jgi:transposase
LVACLSQTHFGLEATLNLNPQKIKIMGKLEKIHQKSAGIDIGSEEIFIALEGESVKSFGTFTESYYQAITYLKSFGITTVAMEATGVYWLSLYDMLEKAGIEVYLVNPNETKNVPGRKTDVQDCQWIQQLHSYGLLRKSYIPESDVRILRSYVRLRSDHIQMASTHVQHMQQGLTLMNIKVQQVISQIQGKSGLRIIEAILSGERDPHKLCMLCDSQILKKKKEDVIKSLEGNYTEEHLFKLQHAYDCYTFYKHKIDECDQKIEELLNKMTAGKNPPEKKGKIKQIRHHKPNVDRLHDKMVMMNEGKDLTVLPGITDYTLMKLHAEIGFDLSCWPSEKHFVSWLGLAPGKNDSGKSSKRSKKRTNTKAGQIFRETAQSLIKSKHIALGSFGRRIRARKGPSIAIKATARKLAVMFYNIHTKGLDYVEQGVKKYEEQYREQMIKFIMKKANELNLQLSLNQANTQSVHW